MKSQPGHILDSKQAVVTTPIFFVALQKPSSFKCGTFGASSIVERRLATGNFTGWPFSLSNVFNITAWCWKQLAVMDVWLGQLQIWDLESSSKPVFEVQAHASIVNAIDGCGGPVSLAGIWESGHSSNLNISAFCFSQLLSTRIICQCDYDLTEPPNSCLIHASMCKSRLRDMVHQR